MKIDVFAKKITTKNGKTFYKKISTLTNKEGEKIYVDVRIPEEEESKLGNLQKTITFDKHNANMTTKEVDGKDGKTYTNRTLWIKKIDTVNDYIDTSLDDFE